MRTSVPFCTNTLMLLGIDVRIVIITFLSIVFFASLANAEVNTSTSTDSYSVSNIIGNKKGNQLILELDAIEIANYQILIDGIPYQGQFISHEYKNINVFNFSELENETFFVHEMNVDGKTLSGTFNGVKELVDYININTHSEWSFDETRQLMFGGNDINQLMITKKGNDGKSSEFSSVSVEIKKNIIIEIPEGTQTVTVNNFVNNYSESIDINKHQQMAAK